MAPNKTEQQSSLPCPSPLVMSLQHKLDYDQLTNCMRCGFCLPACPTFRETGVEPESPRGRIALMKAVVDGIMEPDESFRKQMDHCVGCRACEPACPADVKYGHLIEQARDAIEDHTKHNFLVTALRTFLFKGILPKQSRVQKLGFFLRLYQKSGLRWLAHRLGIMRLFPKPVREMESILPLANHQGVVEQLGTIYPAKGMTIARVGLFRGCIMDVLFTETNMNTVKLLAEAGFEVVIPATQNCCGALGAHSGEMDRARLLAKQNIQAFKEAEVDYIVTNAGGCGALLIEYDHLLKDDETWQKDAAWFAERVIDVSQLLVDRGNVPLFAHPAQDEEPPLTVTYQDSCHLRNVMGTISAPRQLMKRVAHVHFVELFEAERCCGSGGIYNITQPEMAGQILQHKMEHVEKTQAHVLLTSNPGCLLQMKVGIEKHQPEEQRMKAMHVVDFLYERIVKK